MAEGVSWPKASEGGRVVGKDGIRAYWQRQWKGFNPRVEPLEVFERDDGTTHVRVHQIVKGLDGELLADGEVWHIYTITEGLIRRMDLTASEAGEQPKPSSAFSRS